MALGQGVAEKAEEFGELLGEVVNVGAGLSVAPQCERFDGAAAGGAADAKVDAIGIERVEHAEAFDDLERAVVRQKHRA